MYSYYIEFQLSSLNYCPFASQEMYLQLLREEPVGNTGCPDIVATEKSLFILFQVRSD